MLALLRGYKLLISPYFRGSCRFLPSCADYAAEAIDRHGVAARRLAGRRAGSPAAIRSARPGHDPVPHADVTARCPGRPDYNGTTRSPRHLPVVPGAVRLPGAVREAGPEAGSRRRRSRAARRAAAGATAAGARPTAAAPAASADAGGRRPRPRRSSATPAERDVRVETQRRHRRLHEPRRAAQELAPEALPRSAASSRWSSSRTSSRDAAAAVLAATSDDAASTATLNGALYTVERRAERRRVDRRRPICGSSTATAPAFTRSRNSSFEPASYVVDVPRDGDAGGERRRAGDRVGPGASATSARGQPLRAGSRGAALRQDGKVQRLAAEGHREAADVRRRLRLRRRRRPLLHDGRARRRARARSPISRSRFRRRPARRTPARELMSYSLEPQRRRRAGEVLRRARRTSTCSRRSTAISSARSTSACSPCIVVPLLRSLKWINGYVGNYGWSIIILTVIINVDHVPAAAQERRVDAEDAGDSAGGEGDPGSLREAEDDRSGASRR